MARDNCWRLLKVVTPEFFHPKKDPTSSPSISYRTLLHKRTEENLEEPQPTHPSAITGCGALDSLVPKAQPCYSASSSLDPSQPQSHCWTGLRRDRAAASSSTHLPSVSSTGTPAPHHRGPRRCGLGCSSQRRSTGEDYSPSEAEEPSQSLIHCWKATAIKRKAGHSSREI